MCSKIVSQGDENTTDLFGTEKQKQLFDSDDDDAVPTGPSTEPAPVEPAIKVTFIVISSCSAEPLV